MNKHDFEPAMPVQDCASWQFHGISVRDYFAAELVPQMWISATDDTSMREIAKQAYAMADAMLQERAK